MLTKLRIEHYKSVSSARIELSNINVFVGRNSVGKSNIIESLLYIRDCLRTDVDHATSDKHGIDSILQWSRYRPYNLEVHAHFESKRGNGSYAVRMSSKNREPIIISEAAEWTSADNQIGNLSFTRSEKGIKVTGIDDNDSDIFGSRTNFLQVEGDELLLRSMRFLPLRSFRPMSELYVQFTSIESYSIFPNTIRYPQKPTSETRLSPSGDNLTSILRNLVSSKSSVSRNNYLEIIRTMKKVIPNLDRILVRNISGLLWPVFEVIEDDGRKHQFNVSQVSDGALRILGILIALYQPNPPSIIAIEEPEQNLHPGALGLLADAFKDAALKTQIIITTHSPHFIDFFDISQLYAVENNSGITQVGRVSNSQRAAVTEGLMSAGEILANQGFEMESSHP